MPVQKTVLLTGEIVFVTSGGYPVIQLHQPFGGHSTVVVTDKTVGWSNSCLSKQGLKVVVNLVNQYHTGLEALRLAAIN